MLDSFTFDSARHGAMSDDEDCSFRKLNYHSPPVNDSFSLLSQNHQTGATLLASVDEKYYYAQTHENTRTDHGMRYYGQSSNKCAREVMSSQLPPLIALRQGCLPTSPKPQNASSSTLSASNSTEDFSMQVEKTEVPSPSRTPTGSPTLMNRRGTANATRLMKVQSPVVTYRNLFHVLTCQLPKGMEHYENWRVYSSIPCGYSGNAIHFKKEPEVNEKALIFYCSITGPDGVECKQCETCKEYCGSKKAYKLNPKLRQRIAIVKSNHVKTIEKGVFAVRVNRNFDFSKRVALP